MLGIMSGVRNILIVCFLIITYMLGAVLAMPISDYLERQGDGRQERAFVEGGLGQSVRGGLLRRESSEAEADAAASPLALDEESEKQPAVALDEQREKQHWAPVAEVAAAAAAAGEEAIGAAAAEHLTEAAAGAAMVGPRPGVELGEDEKEKPDVEASKAESNENADKEKMDEENYAEAEKMASSVRIEKHQTMPSPEASTNFSSVGGCTCADGTPGGMGSNGTCYKDNVPCEAYVTPIEEGFDVSIMKSAYSTSCAPDASSPGAPCYGSFDECKSAAMAACEAESTCKAFQVPFNGAMAANYTGAKTSAWAIGYLILTCNATTPDLRWVHYTKADPATRRRGVPPQDEGPQARRRSPSRNEGDRRREPLRRRTQAITNAATNTGWFPVGSPYLQRRRRTTLQISVDCFGYWQPWSDCPVSCGGGNSSRDYKVVTLPRNGTNCPAWPEYKPCNTQACPIDCAGDWSDWSSCTMSCGGGFRSRSFFMNVMPRNGGAHCPAPAREPCNEMECPVDCVFFWGPWSECTKTCGGGSQKRAFGVQQNPKNGGKECPNYHENQTCNSESCPQNCEGTWTEWGSCSETCGGGQRSRTFTIDTLSNFGGAECPASPEIFPCNAMHCPIDCVGQYTAWTACTQTCGTGMRNRNFNIERVQQYGGQPCPSSFNEEKCNTHECPVDCAGKWSDWTECSRSCDAGSQSRKYTVTQQTAFGGVFCPSYPETKVCNNGPCPIDCVGYWNMWSTCTQTCGTGSRARTFNISIVPQFNGKECPTPETQDCNQQPCPVDCQGTWTGWSYCTKSCGGGTTSKNFTVTVLGDYGGLPCPSPEIRACNTTNCPVDCVGAWAPWSTCTVSCGGGLQSRNYTIAQEPQYGGAECPQTQYQNCSVHECPVDCDGEWTDWGTCSKTCGGGTRQRNYTAAIVPAFGGVPCPDPKIESCKTVGCPVDCAGTWGSWSGCTQTCGGGLQRRHYAVTIAAQFDGLACPISPENKTCASQDCPVDCVGDWEPWSDCTSPCGDNGTQNRSFTVTANATGGGACPTFESKDCNRHVCPVDCEGNWGSWTSCSKTCGGGTRTRNYIATVEPQGAGIACPLPQSQSCHSHMCPVNCPGYWSQWSVCSKSCGGGTRTRIYFANSTNAQSNSASVCPHPENETCSTSPCPQNCPGQWNDWSDCDKTCGGGIQTRNYSLAYPGNATDPTYMQGCLQPESRSCASNACPVDCVGSWNPWSACSATCGGGTMTRTYNAITPASSGGTPCPEDRTEGCNLDPCWSSQCKAFFVGDLQPLPDPNPTGKLDCRSAGCRDTLRKSCPDQGEGTEGFAVNDSSMFYNCCCGEKLWKHFAAHVNKHCVHSCEDDQCAGNATNVIPSGQQWEPSGVPDSSDQEGRCCNGFSKSCTVCCKPVPGTGNCV